MNSKPNISGINRYWKPGEDSRVEIAKRIGLDPSRPDDRERMDRFLSGLLHVVCQHRRTKIVGFGVFEWLKWKNRIPTGRVVETWRLSFKPGRYVKERYNGSR